GGGAGGGRGGGPPGGGARGKLLEPYRMAGHQPERLDVHDEPGRRAVGPALHRRRLGHAVVGRVDLDRRVALRVPGKPPARGHLLRVPVPYERVVGPRAGADANRCRHPPILESSGWNDGRSACSTPAWAGSPSCTSAS